MIPESGDRATIIDVSKKAKVSISTVSRVINGSAGVREEPRRRVEEAIKELGYRPSYSARLLKTQKSYSIFILVPEIDNPYYTDIYHGARIAMEVHGYMAFLFEASDPQEVLKAIVARGADGVILDVRYASLAEKILGEADIPFTVFNVPSQFEQANSVKLNLFETLKKLCLKLYAMGHHSIAFVADRPVDEHAHDRLPALKKAAEEAGISFDPSLVAIAGDGSDQFDCGRRGFERLRETGLSPDALIAINDLVAMGAMAAARDAGLEIPRDLSVVGFDDAPAGRYASPPLATVNLPTGKQGELAAEMLLKIIDEPGSETYSVTLDTEILFRESVLDRS